MNTWKFIIVILSINQQAQAATSPSSTQNDSNARVSEAGFSEERAKLYEQEGMGYAKKLFTKLDGTKEDEIRNQKAELLNYQLRKQTIDKTESLLKKNKNKAIIAELVRRLGKLHEQQAETVSRRTDIKDKSGLIKKHLDSAIRHFERLQREYPNYFPDETLYSLGDNYLKQKNITKAESSFSKIVNKFPNSPFLADTFLEIGNIEFDKKQFAKARQTYTKIQQISGSTLIPFSHYKSAWCYFNEGEVDLAIQGLVNSIKESRRMSAEQKNGKKLGVEDEALSDLVLFYSEKKDVNGAKDFFTSITDREKSKELRVQLAKRFFDHGQNKLALQSAADVLADSPANDQVTKLHMIVISASEKINDRKASIEHLGKISEWLKKNPQPEPITAEAEEFIRNFALKLHHEAETLKKKEIWANAKHAYISYLNTFTKEKEIPEMRYRFAVLLMHLNENRYAYTELMNYFLTPEINKHARHKESRKLLIQTFELAKNDEKVKFNETEMFKAFEAFASEYPKEELAPEAAYKAAQLAKKFESPEILSQRFRKIAAAYPSHSLAKSSISESLSILVKGEKWALLKSESTILLGNSVELRDKISEANELATIKLIEQDEKANKYAEVKKQLDDFIATKPSQSSMIFALLKLAKTNEEKLRNDQGAIDSFEKLRADYPKSKEAIAAQLEIARLYEKQYNPKLAAKTYFDYAQLSNLATNNQALTNAAVLFEQLGDFTKAAQAFFELETRSQKPEEKRNALAAACNNLLLASHSDTNSKVFEKIANCSEKLSNIDIKNYIFWTAHLAWAREKIGMPSEAKSTWKKIAAIRNKDIKEEGHKAYVGYARSFELEGYYNALTAIRFSAANEKPEANIGKKTKAMEALETKVQNILPYASPKLAAYANELLGKGYLDFADVMENAAVPSRLSDQEKVDLKNSFIALAKDLREKGYGYAPQLRQDAKREIASAPERKKHSYSGSKLSDSGWKEALLDLQFPEKELEAIVRITDHFYKLEKWSEARFSALKWKKILTDGINAGKINNEKLSSSQNLAANEEVMSDLQQIFPEQDPLTEVIF